MKTLPLAALLLAGLPLGAAPALAPALGTETVTVVVTRLASTHAAVKLTFYNSPTTFLHKGQQALWRIVQPGGRQEISVPVQLAPGEWAVALTQDTNNNDKLDKNFLGIPTEPYAFSNNIRPRLAAPTFQECKFMVSGPGKVVRITLKD
jgi:uncharacterized protein (DUF2141 family)